MSVDLEVQMTPRTMYSFMIHHNYTQLSGILSVIMGIVAFIIGVQQIGRGNVASAIVLIVFGVAVVVYSPIMLWTRAKRQVEASPVFLEPLVYKLTEDGVKVIQGGKENESPWSDFQKAISTNWALVLYMDKTRAIIFPREQIGERWAAAVEMISTHMPPDKVKIRQVN